MIPTKIQEIGLNAVVLIDQSPLGCSLFATLSISQDHLYVRNFDWRYSPALLLFNRPSDGFTSVSMIDLGYLMDDAKESTH